MTRRSLTEGLMETVSGIYAFLMGNIVTFILVLSLLVFVHEMGHYLVGRWSGIRILAFSVGFGPEIFGFTDRHGTRWKISVVPLGGYVRFFGDEDASSKPDADKIAAMSEEDRARSLPAPSCGNALQPSRLARSLIFCSRSPSSPFFSRSMAARSPILSLPRSSPTALPLPPASFQAICWSPSTAARSRPSTTCAATSASARARRSS